MPKKSMLEIPEDMAQLASQLIPQRERLRRTQAQQQQKAAALAKKTREKRRQEEERQQRIALQRAKRILNWADALRKSATGKELIELGDAPDKKGFCFFDGKAPGAPQQWLGVITERMWYHGFG